MLSESEILIGWTTLGDKALADSFAAKLVETSLAVLKLQKKLLRSRRCLKTRPGAIRHKRMN